MPRTTLLLVPLLALAAPAVRAADLASDAAVTTAPDDPGGGGAVNGLYPLWEGTARVHPAGSVEVGYQHAQVGLGRVQLGTQPIMDLHGAFNADAKVQLWRGSRLQVALTLGGYRIPTAAEARSVGNLNPFPFTNPYAPVWLFPVTLAKSLRLERWLTLHWASTLLFSQSAAPEHRYVSGGQTLMLEAAAGPHWSARLHAGAEGWPVQTQAHAGLSFAYTGKYAFVAAGVARRFAFDGEAANLILLDGGLLFQ
jgi:hypothetical protein